MPKKKPVSKMTRFTEKAWNNLTMNKHVVFFISIGLIVNALFVLLSLTAGPIGVAVLVIVLFLICGGVGIRLSYMLKERDAVVRSAIHPSDQRTESEKATQFDIAVDIGTQTEEEVVVVQTLDAEEGEGLSQVVDDRDSWTNLGPDDARPDTTMGSDVGSSPIPDPDGTKTSVQADVHNSNAPVQTSTAPQTTADHVLKYQSSTNNPQQQQQYEEVPIV